MNNYYKYYLWFFNDNAISKGLRLHGDRGDGMSLLGSKRSIGGVPQSSQLCCCIFGARGLGGGLRLQAITAALLFPNALGDSLDSTLILFGKQLFSYCVRITAISFHLFMASVEATGIPNFRYLWKGRKKKIHKILISEYLKFHGKLNFHALRNLTAFMEAWSATLNEG